MFSSTKRYQEGVVHFPDCRRESKTYQTYPYPHILVQYMSFSSILFQTNPRWVKHRTLHRDLGFFAIDQVYTHTHTLRTCQVVGRLRKHWIKFDHFNQFNLKDLKKGHCDLKKNFRTSGNLDLSCLEHLQKLPPFAPHPPHLVAQVTSAKAPGRPRRGGEGGGRGLKLLHFDRSLAAGRRAYSNRCNATSNKHYH